MKFSSKIHKNNLEKLEIFTTVIWLLYFLGVALPSPFPSFINTLSYPVIFCLVILHRRRLSYVATRNLPILLLVCFALASIFWSSVLTETIPGLRGLLRTTMFGVYFATRYSIKEQIRLITWVFGIAAILNLVSCLLIPSYGISSSEASSGGEWQGIFAHKNLMARAMTVSSILFFLKALLEKDKNWLMGLGFCLSIGLIIMSQSKTSLTTFLILIMIVPIFKIIERYYRTKVFIFISFCLIVGSIATLILGNLEFIVVDVLGKNLEFNGRLPLWSLIVEKSLERPWIGHGYQGFWLSDSGQSVISNSWASLSFKAGVDSFNAHNGYLELFAQLGVLGLFLYILSFGNVLISTITSLIKKQELEYFFIFQFLVFIFLFNLAVGNTILSGNNSYWIMYVSFTISLSLEKIRRKKQLQKHKLALNS